MYFLLTSLRVVTHVWTLRIRGFWMHFKQMGNAGFGTRSVLAGVPTQSVGTRITEVFVELLLTTTLIVAILHGVCIGLRLLNS